MAVLRRGYAYARSLAFYRTVNIWLWLRVAGDLVFAGAAALLGLDFLGKVRASAAPPAPSPPGGNRLVRQQLAEILQIQANTLDHLEKLAGDRWPDPTEE